jgi:ferric-dicitrate binding protein FerR (iron transport regulator)
MADRALFEIHLHDGITFSPTASGFGGWRRGDDEADEVEEEMDEMEEEMDEMEDEMEELEDEMEELEESSRGPGRMLVLLLVLAVGIALGMKMLGGDSDEMDRLDDIAEEYDEGEEETVEQ